MKPTIDPELVRNLVTVAGAILTAAAGTGEVSWRTIAMAIGGALFGWARRAPGHVAIDELPYGIQELIASAPRIPKE